MMCVEHKMCTVMLMLMMHHQGHQPAFRPTFIPHWEIFLQEKYFARHLRMVIARSAFLSQQLESAASLLGIGPTIIIISYP